MSRGRAKAAVVAGLVFTAAAADGAVPTALAPCLQCHAARVPDDRAALAPLYGTCAAAQPGVRYSRALRAAGLRWDAAALDAYLADPGARVPGTTMTLRVADAGERAAIIAAMRAFGRGDRTPAAHSGGPRNAVGSVDADTAECRSGRD